MARTPDDDADDRPTRRRTRPNHLPWIIGIAGVGGLLALALCGGLALVFMAGRDVGGPVGGPTVKKTYTREEFRKMVEGKSESEVRDLLGAPDSTSDFGDGGVVWVYREKATDPATGKTGNAQVWMEQGKVAKVAFP